MNFKTNSEAKKFGFEIGATHVLNRGGFYLFLHELKNKIPRFAGSKVKVDLVYNIETKEWQPWYNLEYGGSVFACKDAVKIGLLDG